LGTFEVAALKDEEPARQNARRSLVARVDIPAGKVIGESDLTFKRPAHGVSPKHIDEVVGKKANRRIEKDELIKWNLLE
jgi:sialic acid synthase SpsE